MCLLVETARPEMGVSEIGRHTKCAGLGVLQDRFGNHWHRKTNISIKYSGETTDFSLVTYARLF